MSKRQVYFVKAGSAREALGDVGIKKIGSGWPGEKPDLWLCNKTAVYHQHKRFKVVCTYRRLHVSNSGSQDHESQ